MRSPEPREEPASSPVRPAPAPGGAARDACADLRCCCGSLLARRVDAGVELKCRRCKRTFVLSLADS